ncbi:MAG: hypothetical protein COA94_01955 [Rickettsiales bacterium]|nr:MAG: hypothetical protein COA94_01955 [Rickettsiales bacterium]
MSRRKVEDSAEANTEVIEKLVAKTRENSEHDNPFPNQLGGDGGNGGKVSFNSSEDAVSTPLPPLTFATFNACTDTRVEEGSNNITHSEWRAEARMPKVLETLDKLGTDIIAIQELRNCPKAKPPFNSTGPVNDHLEHSGYTTSVTFYRDGFQSEGASRYILAFKESRFTHIETETKYFTQSPDKFTDDYFASTYTTLNGKQEHVEAVKDHNFGMFFERGIQVTRLFDKETRETLCIFNVHYPIPKDLRIKASELLRDFAQAEQELHPNIKIIIAGDFNSFPNWGGEEQMKPLIEAGFVDALTDATFPNETPADSTFYAFPYDLSDKQQKLNAAIESWKEQGLSTAELALNIDNFYLEEGRKSCEIIDHILVLQQEGSMQNTVVQVQPLFDNFTGYEPEAIGEYVFSHAHGGDSELGPAFASDHMPVSTTIVWDREVPALGDNSGGDF